MFDYIRVTCAVPDISVGDVWGNCEKMCLQLREAKAAGSGLVVFPELSLTGATCGDLFYQKSLTDACLEALKKLQEETARLNLVAVVGLPVRSGGALYNCAAVLDCGKVAGLVQKTKLGEDARWFAAAPAEMGNALPGVEGSRLCGNQLFLLADGTTFAVEIGEEATGPVSVGTMQTLQGAELIVNPKACRALAGGRARQRRTAEGFSARCRCAYVSVSAGAGESTTDYVYSGHSILAENGKILGENERVTDSGYTLTRDIDVGLIRSVRLRDGAFRPGAKCCGETDNRPAALDGSAESDGALYHVRKHPFIPANAEARREKCLEMFEIQVAGLKKRMTVTGGKAVVGISGGLDSTLALLVAVEANRALGRPASDVVGITMPCFGTTGRTKNNALVLMETLGVTAMTIPIGAAVEQHFLDIGHEKTVTDLTFENAQARERTQVLMDYAGKIGGFVIGTGDLSELALGWCTYNGDHMSMYGVNGSIPKTLLRSMVDTLAGSGLFSASEAVLRDILDTPISPELLPPKESGAIAQQTEDLVGPYDLHDFFLYYALRYGFTPGKIYALACRAFDGEFDRETIKKWLKNFYRRFVSQQFKRSCMAEGVAAGSMNFSPRGAWQMPGDASARLWCKEAEEL